ncbi:hypothetical protein CN246_07990 [Ethanoligenens harbinense]|nr:hypothetical protein CN246_07990 [Ethanoligenens harbinense]
MQKQAFSGWILNFLPCPHGRRRDERQVPCRHTLVQEVKHMCWPWIFLLPLACCCGNRGGCNRTCRPNRNPCRHLDDPNGTFPKMNVYRGYKPCCKKHDD